MSDKNDSDNSGCIIVLLICLLLSSCEIESQLRKANDKKATDAATPTTESKEKP